MTRVAYVDCIGGFAGDMFLAAALDAGAPARRLIDLPAELGLTDVMVEVTETTRLGLRATHVTVVDAGTETRTWTAADIAAAIDRSVLRSTQRERARSALDRLVSAESEVHGRSVDEVHLHELGSVDTLIDLCGAAVVLDELRVERLVCSPLPYARALVDATHGPLPSPAPAVLAMLRGTPFVGVDTQAELVTPTGAAILAAMCDAFGGLPAMTLETVGHGAGTRELEDRPNIVRLVIGEAVGGTPATRDVVVVEASLDDLIPELVPDAVERCFAAGALDVWTTPVQMKKGRPGFILSALARPEVEADIALAILEHTTTLGVRVAALRRHELERQHREVEVAGGVVRVKVGLSAGRVVNVAPEHDDCARVANEAGLPVKEVWALAMAAARQMQGVDGPAR